MLIVCMHAALVLEGVIIRHGNLDELKAGKYEVFLAR